MTSVKELLTWEDFKKIELRKGTIVKAEDFPEARSPSYKIWVDFGTETGIKKTSAQIKGRYRLIDLPGKSVIGVTNFPAKQIGPFMSEFLLTGFEDGNADILLATCDPDVPDGALLK